jgi:hypothetical protein
MLVTQIALDSQLMSSATVQAVTKLAAFLNNQCASLLQRGRAPTGRVWARRPLTPLLLPRSTPTQTPTAAPQSWA